MKTITQQLANKLAEVFGTDGDKVDQMITALEAIEANQTDNSPLSAFGEMLTVEPTPQFQGVFNQTLTLPKFVTNVDNGGSGSVSYENSMLKLQCGTALGGYATLRTKKFIRYNPGRGSVFKGTAIFDTANAVANSVQYIGMGTAESGFYFGYDGTKFAVHRQIEGRLYITALKITTKSTNTENITVELNGVNYSVAVTDQTAGTVNNTAAEIAQGTFNPGAPFTPWNAYAVGDTVYFIQSGTGPATGAYSITGTSVAGTFTRNQAGVANTWDRFYMNPADGTPWNYNGGTGLGFTLDPANGNVYRITVGYLGFDGVLFEIKSPVTGKWVAAHYLDYKNANTTPICQEPAMQALVASASLGSTTNITVYSASISGEVQGKSIIDGEIFAFTNSQASIATSTTWYNVLTIRVNRTFGAVDSHKVNRGQIKLVEASMSLIGGAKPGEVAIFKNATLNAAGPAVDPSQWLAVNSNSMVSYYSAEVDVTGGTVISGSGISNGTTTNIDLSQIDHFGESADTYTLAVRVPLGGASPDAVGSFKWQEDN